MQRAKDFLYALILSLATLAPLAGGELPGGEWRGVPFVLGDGDDRVLLWVPSVGRSATAVDLDGTAAGVWKNSQQQFPIRFAWNSRACMETIGWDVAIGIGAARRPVPESDYLSHVMFNPAGVELRWMVRATAENRGEDRPPVGGYGGEEDLIPPPIVAGIVGCAADLYLTKSSASILESWQVGRLGDGSRLDVFSEGRGGIFGVLSGVRSTSDFQNSNLNSVSALNTWQLTAIGNRNCFTVGPSPIDPNWLPPVTWHYENSNGAIAGLASNLGGHSHKLLNAWKVDGIGSANRFLVMARDRGTVFGLIANMGPRDGVRGGNDWFVGPIADANLFSSTAGVASVFGLANSLGGDTMGELFNRWSFSSIGSSNTFSATSAATTAVSTHYPSYGQANFSLAGVFGLVADVGMKTANSMLCDWNFGKIGNCNNFSASAAEKQMLFENEKQIRPLSIAGIFGLIAKVGFTQVAGADPAPALLNGWEFTEIGDCNQFTARAIRSAGIFATLMNAGIGGESGTIFGQICNNWKFGQIGNRNSFRAEVRQEGDPVDPSSARAGIFGVLGNFGIGPSSPGPLKLCSNWQFSGLGDDNYFCATARSAGAEANAGIFGLLAGFGSKLNSGDIYHGWHIGWIGNRNTFLAEADGSIFTAAGIFGVPSQVGVTNCDNFFSNWQFHGLGDDNYFCATARSTRATTSAGIFGFLAGFGSALDGANAFHGWDIGRIGNRNTFLAEADGSIFTAAGIFGVPNQIGVTNCDNFFSNWQFSGLGDDNYFCATARSTTLSANAGIFGLLAGVGCGLENKDVFRGWNIGLIGNRNTFLARANGSIYAIAGIFGVSAQTGLRKCKDLFPDWTFTGFGDWNVFSAEAEENAGSGAVYSAIFGLDGDGGCTSELAPSRYRKWEFGKFGHHNNFSSRARSQKAGIYAGIFSLAWGGGAPSSSNFAASYADRWTFEGFGKHSTFHASAEAIGNFENPGFLYLPYVVAASGIFALEIDVGRSSNNSICNSWEFRSFDGEGTFLSDVKIENCDTFNIICAYAGIFGTLCKSGIHENSNVFSAWSIKDFGNGNVFRASIEGAHTVGGAGIFGLQVDCGVGSSSSVFNGWSLGRFGDDNRFSASVCGGGTANNQSYAGIFGILCRGGSAGESSFHKWKFAGFGNGNAFEASASCHGSVVGAGIFGLQIEYGTSKSSFSAWSLGRFGNGNRFHSVAWEHREESNQANAYGTIFGALCKLGFSGENYFGGWTFAGFGDGNGLRVDARTASGIAGASIFALRLDGGEGSNVSFKDWKIGPIGDDNRFVVSVYNGDSSATSARGEAYGGIFGTVARLGFGGGAPFSHWAFDGFGRRNVFSTTVSSTSGKAFAGIFGTIAETAFATATPFCDWFVGPIGNRSSLTAVASAGSRAFATVFGSGFNMDKGTIFHNWSVELQGSQAIAALTHAPKAWNSNPAALGGAHSNAMRFYFNGKNSAGPVAVTIAAAKLAEPWDFSTGAARAAFYEMQDDHITWIVEGGAIKMVSRPFSGWGLPATIVVPDNRWFAITSMGANEKLWFVNADSQKPIACDGELLKSGDLGFDWKLVNEEWGQGAWRVQSADGHYIAEENGEWISYHGATHDWYRINANGDFVDADGNKLFYVEKDRTCCGEGDEPCCGKEDGICCGKGDEICCGEGDGICCGESDGPCPGEESETCCGEETCWIWIRGDDQESSPIPLSPIVFNSVSTADRAWAVALGPNFQLNVGRTRAVKIVKEGKVEWPEETEESIEQGGFSDGRAGILNLIGAVDRAVTVTSTAGSRLRIDSGWTVNCFAPVREVESTEILHGRMVLMARDESGRRALQRAVDQLNGAICIATNEEEDGQLCPKIFGGGSSANNHAGNVQLDASNYPILGHLTIAGGQGQRLLFGTALRWKDGDGWVHHTMGQLVLRSSSANIYNSWLELIDKNPVFALHLAEADAPFAGPVNSLVVSMPDAADGDAMQALFSVANRAPSFGAQLTNLRGEGTDYYFLGNDGSLSQKLLLDMAEDHGYEKEATGKLHLLWLDSATRRGLVIASVDENRILKEDLDPILPLPLRFSPGDDSLGGAQFFFFHGELARFLLAANNLRFSDLRDHCCDVRGSDPFVSAFHGHLEQRASKNTPAFGCNLRGLTLGEDFAWAHGASTLLRLGACISHVNGTLRTFDLPEPLSKTARPRLSSASAFAAREHWNGKSLKFNALASIALGIGSGKVQRVDGDGSCYHGKSALKFASFRGEVAHNVFRCNGLQLGPWCGANYTILRQGRYGERGSGDELVNAPASRQNFCHTLLGINLERAGLSESKRGLRFCAKLGWECRIVQHCHADLGTIAESGLDAFRPQFYPGDKNLCHVSTSVRQRLDEHWNLSGTWQGNFGKCTSQHSLALTAGYVF